MGKNFIFLSLGIVIGAAVSYWYAKKKYERIANEEINSVRDYYHNKKSVSNNDVDESDKSDRKLYADAVKAVADYAGYENERQEEQMNDNNNINIISPDDFGEEYETITLYCYDDGTITDFYDKKILDPERIIGSINPKDHFGEYEDDSVFVRNDTIKRDIEILSTCGDYEEEDG